MVSTESDGGAGPVSLDDDDSSGWAGPPLKVGDKIMTQGLVGFPHLDNRVGHILAWVSPGELARPGVAATDPAGPGMWAIKLHDREISVPEANLRPFVPWAARPFPSVTYHSDSMALAQLDTWSMDHALSSKAEQQQALLAAIINDSSEMCEWLRLRAEKRGDEASTIGYVDNLGRDVMWWACFSGAENVVKWSVKWGGNVLTKDQCGTTALAAACGSANARAARQDHEGGATLELVQYLCKQGARSGEHVFAPDTHGKTPLSRALESNEIPVVMYLVEMGSPVRQEDVPEEKAEIYHQLTAWVEKSGGRAMEPPKTMPSMTRRKTPTGIRPSPAKRTPSGLESQHESIAGAGDDEGDDRFMPGSVQRTPRGGRKKTLIKTRDSRNSRNSRTELPPTSL
uniref:Uncharacterized protein n=1 Tax=Florenciella parvula TaxID=236787 RepID=A0A7S2B0Y1_9STRA|mmetsp:Transcript_11669/g.24562  ORF Transcript_11669/g.24562 Transcript_11669/m.24562 type:complete len:399 (+) Transcript_11669:131-1327(+)